MFRLNASFSPSSEFDESLRFFLSLDHHKSLADEICFEGELLSFDLWRSDERAGHGEAVTGKNLKYVDCRRNFICCRIDRG